MFDLIAVDANGRIFEKLIKFKLENSSFRVSASTSGVRDGETVVTSGLPRFGGNQTTSAFDDMEFERAFGIFQVADAQGAPRIP